MNSINNLRAILEKANDLEMQILDERRVMSCVVSDLNYKTAVKAVSKITFGDIHFSRSYAVADNIEINDEFNNHFSKIEGLVYDRNGIDKQYEMLEKTGYIYYLARMYDAIGNVSGLVLRRVMLNKGEPIV